jgi:hypothetical protein
VSSISNGGDDIKELKIIANAFMSLDKILLWIAGKRERRKKRKRPCRRRSEAQACA